jgi:hypothetical protein
MSSKINLEVIEGEGLNFVTRLSNATLEALLKLLPFFATPPKWAAFPSGPQV